MSGYVSHFRWDGDIASAAMYQPVFRTSIGFGWDVGVVAAIDEGMPAPLISAALVGRFESRGEAGYADRLRSAMRKLFGGHDEKKKGE